MLNQKQSFYNWCYNNLSEYDADRLLSRWDYKLNVDINGNVISPKDISHNSTGLNKMGYWFKCSGDNPEHKSEQRKIVSIVHRKTHKADCVQCKRSENSVAIRYPDQIHYFLNESDAYENTFGSHKYVDMKCPYCENIKSMQIGRFLRQGLCCPKCSDKVPYPEKFMFNLLEQLGFDFEVQVKFPWSKYQYDFYIKILNFIIETHGSQHYSDKHCKNWDDLLETQENDRLKRQVAEEENDKEYEEVNCSKSEMEWMKDHIMGSKLPQILGFKESDVDFYECHRHAMSSLVIKCCDLWNSGTKILYQIAEILKLSPHTVSKYLVQGFEIGKCEYSAKIPVICVTTGEIFNDASEACNVYDTYSSLIHKNCRYEAKSAGIHPKNRKKLVWMYHDDYILKSENEIMVALEARNNRSLIHCASVVCINTGEVFESMSDASSKYKCYDISECCSGKVRYSGILLTGERLVWMKCKDYDLKTQDELKEILSNAQEELLRVKVICLNTNVVYESIMVASKELNIKHSTISACSLHKRASAGTILETGEPLVWMIYDEFITSTKEQIKEKLDKAKRKEKRVICVTTGKIFDSFLEASKYYNLHPSSISQCCSGVTKSGGKHPDNKKIPLVWKIFDGDDT